MSVIKSHLCGLKFFTDRTIFTVKNWMRLLTIFGNFWKKNNKTINFIGYAFATRSDLKDILFKGTDLTGLDLFERSRHRLWKWLDHRHLLGFNSQGNYYKMHTSFSKASRQI